MNITSHIKRLLPLLVIGTAVLAFFILVWSKESPQAKVQREAGVLVRTMEISRQVAPLEVSGGGVVNAVQEAQLAAEVEGRVVWRADDFVVGGFFKEGEPLFRIDERDYKLQLDIAQSEVAQMQRDLEIAKANAAVAQSEFELLKDITSEDVTGKDASSLLLYKPQLKSAQANLRAAQARLNQAKLDLERTTITAPFNCFVRSKEVEVGQFVRAGESAGTFVGTDAVEIIVPLSVENIQWVSDNQSKAKVWIDAAGKYYEWDGIVDRELADVEDRGRMHRLAIKVKDPYRLQSKEKGLALSVGSYARVKVFAGELADSIVIPRSALHEDNTVWLANSDDLLEIRKVELARQDREQVIVASGLEPGERLILTKFSGAVNGLKLRPLAGSGEL